MKRDWGEGDAWPGVDSGTVASRGAREGPRRGARTREWRKDPESADKLFSEAWWPEEGGPGAPRAGCGGEDTWFWSGCLSRLWGIRRGQTAVPGGRARVRVRETVPCRLQLRVRSYCQNRVFMQVYQPGALPYLVLHWGPGAPCRPNPPFHLKRKSKAEVGREPRVNNVVSSTCDASPETVLPRARPAVTPTPGRTRG